MASVSGVRMREGGDAHGVRGGFPPKGGKPHHPHGGLTHDWSAVLGAVEKSTVGPTGNRRVSCTRTAPKSKPKSSPLPYGETCLEKTMTTTALARIQEAERLISHAIEDVPLTCTAQEAAAAVQGLGLRMAERCVPPSEIAATLLAQAEGYLKAVDEAPGATLDPDEWTEAAHTILTTAGKALMAAGIPSAGAAALMLGYATAWWANGANPATAAENLYRQADAIIGRTQARH